MTEGGW